MKRTFTALVLGLSLLVVSGGIVFAQAVDLATCSSPKGWAYYNYSGLIDKKTSGWNEDGVSGGITTIKKMSDGNYDILIKDTRGSLYSIKQDGGKVMLLRSLPNDMAFLHLSKLGIIEIYNIFKEADGVIKMSLIQNKGVSVKIRKSAVMVGNCSYANLD